MSPLGFSRRAEIGTCISQRESLLATLITFFISQYYFNVNR